MVHHWGSILYFFDYQWLNIFSSIFMCKKEGLVAMILALEPDCSAQKLGVITHQLRFPYALNFKL